MAKVLVVDNEMSLRDALAKVLNVSGHEAQAAASGEEALELIEADIPDVILSDVLMPEMTGPELLALVRSNPDWRHIPFILMSASITISVEGEIASLEHITFLRKPFEIDELLAAVDAAVENNN